MSLIAAALELDRDDDFPVKAADAYEEVLREHPGCRDALVNLIGLYFSTLDAGYSAAHHLSQEFIDRADRRVIELVTHGLRATPLDTELDFWKRYFEFRACGEDWAKVFSPEYESAVARGESLVPYLALFITYKGEKYEPEARSLLAAVREGRTRRERELRSVLESVLHMHRRQV